MVFQRGRTWSQLLAPARWRDPLKWEGHPREVGHLKAPEREEWGGKWNPFQLQAQDVEVCSPTRLEQNRFPGMLFLAQEQYCILNKMPGCVYRREKELP